MVSARIPFSGDEESKGPSGRNRISGLLMVIAEDRIIEDVSAAQEQKHYGEDGLLGGLDLINPESAASPEDDSILAHRLEYDPKAKGRAKAIEQRFQEIEESSVLNYARNHYDWLQIHDPKTADLVLRRKVAEAVNTYSLELAISVKKSVDFVEDILRYVELREIPDHREFTEEYDNYHRAMKRAGELFENPDRHFMENLNGVEMFLDEACQVGSTYQELRDNIIYVLGVAAMILEDKGKEKLLAEMIT